MVTILEEIAEIGISKETFDQILLHMDTHRDCDIKEDIIPLWQLDRLRTYLKEKKY